MTVAYTTRPICCEQPHCAANIEPTHALGACIFLRSSLNLAPTCLADTTRVTLPDSRALSGS